ncbi:TON1 Recruiting Motif 30 [Hibiscus trionum]|uniref:TON1 Recruiting Motif 30 n=1 Tax=Hibiscus trionum TaxID=183268 RepID=A0A9W7LWG6_HIBTR|nr:TON1 Recruiting Motif 30 [Hibiscus trionum]
MAKTSDFAAKLLGDLRLRKERMAASQNYSKATNPMVADAYAYSKTSYRSSGEPKMPKTTGSKAGSTINRPSGGRKSVTTAPASNQIVPFRGGQKSQKIGDPPAVAFALENGGKRGGTQFSVNGTVFNFLHTIGRRQMDCGDIKRKNSKLPAISHLDIEAISSGVQKLNQILRACSNGLNFDRYSIEIGRELLKGAMDLEESLRVLANLQEPSEYSITKPRKSRVTLLEEDEDNDDEKQLDISSFSFGRPSRNYNHVQDVARTDLKLRSKDLTYSSKVTNSRHGKNVVPVSNSHSHKQSAGYGLEIKTLTAFSEQNHSSSLQCKQEKLRIPNVIAKLMGLDELPGYVDSKVTAKESGKQPGKVFTNSYGSIRAAAHDSLPPREATEDIKLMTSSRKATIKIDRQQSDIVRSNHNNASRSEIQKERKHERSETKEPVFEDEMQQMIPYVHKRSEAAVTLQEKTKYGENKLQSKNGFEQVSVLRKSELQKRRPQLEERKQQSSKQKLQGKQNQNEAKRSNFSKPMSGATATNFQKKHPQMNQAATSRKGSTEHIGAAHDGKHRKNQADDRSLTNLNIKIQGSSNRNSGHSRGDQESESAKACIRFTVDEKPVQVQPPMKARIKKGNKLEVPRISEVMTKKGASVYNLLRTLKHPSSNFPERKQTRLEQLAVSRKSEQMKASRFEEVEPKAIRSNESISDQQSSSIPQERQKAAKHDSVLCSVLEDECQNLNKRQELVRKDVGQTPVPMVTNEQQDQEPDLGIAKESQFKNSASNPLHRTNEANIYEKPQNQRTYTSEKPEPLTESENHFKQILTKSQLFMNTAKALFEVSIPMSIFHGKCDEYDEQESKLVLDCGYEVMKRKGRRQELSAHPFLKASIVSSNKAKSMDDMVKQICKDFDKLKLYGREGKEDSSFEDYLPKMVEADVNDMEPDLNCMWGLGWNCMMFACLEKDDVVRDVERYVLNGLLIGITRDLLTAMCISA